MSTKPGGDSDALQYDHDCLGHQNPAGNRLVDPVSDSAVLEGPRWIDDGVTSPTNHPSTTTPKPKPEPSCRSSLSLPKSAARADVRSPDSLGFMTPSERLAELLALPG